MRASRAVHIPSVAPPPMPMTIAPMTRGAAPCADAKISPPHIVIRLPNSKGARIPTRSETNPDAEDTMKNATK